METLQWTLLVGLLGMVAYVLWSRLKASYAKGVAPRVEADWEGEAVALQGDVLEVTVKVRQVGAVHIWLEGPEGVVVEVHEGELTGGVHAWSVARPERTGSWLAKLSCQGHRTERRFHV